jgi:hypothetical protein
MCPKARDIGVFPPPGTDPSVCDRAIMGRFYNNYFIVILIDYLTDPYEYAITL